MRSSSLALMVTGYLALCNRAMKGEKIPSFEGNIEFSGSEIVTGALATVVAFLLFSGFFVSLFETIKEWQVRSGKFDSNLTAEGERSENLGVAFSPLFANPFVYLVIFLFNNWLPIAFGTFVVIKLWPSITLFLCRVVQ